MALRLKQAKMRYLLSLPLFSHLLLLQAFFKIRSQQRAMLPLSLFKAHRTVVTPLT
jgi:hypothetical protein